jgi:hypothetical protein
MHAPHAKAKLIIAISTENGVFSPVKDSKIIFSMKNDFSFRKSQNLYGTFSEWKPMFQKGL